MRVSAVRVRNPALLPLEHHADVTVLQDLLNQTVSDLDRITHLVRLLHGLLAPAQLCVASHVGCGAGVSHVEEPTNGMLAALCGEAESVCAVTINILNLSWEVECINGGGPFCRETL